MAASVIPEPVTSAMKNGADRHILMLQGPSSLFFAALGEAFQEAGAKVTRVGICPGDRLYWRKSAGEYVAYRGDEASWPARATALMEERGITDLVMLGDGRRFHKDAIGAARGLAMPPVPWPVPWIVEHGYLRPDLLTVEPWGTGGRSRLKAGFQAAGADVPQNAGFQSSFLRFALLDTGYHVANLLAAWAVYPKYRNHAIYAQHEEWRGWIGKGLRARSEAKRAADVMKLSQDLERYFVFPLQLETDYQIRDHYSGGSVDVALAEVIASFAKLAEGHLIVKAHPMDNGLVKWRARVQELAERHGIGARVHYLNGGDLDALLTRAAGCVTINSTVGLSAAGLSCPVHCLGDAIYDLPGITYETDLDGFFANPRAPDPAQVAAFVAYLHETVLVAGAFEGSGVVPGAANVAAKILAGPVFEESAL